MSDLGVMEILMTSSGFSPAFVSNVDMSMIFGL